MGDAMWKNALKEAAAASNRASAAWSGCSPVVPESPSQRSSAVASAWSVWWPSSMRAAAENAALSMLIASISPRPSPPRQIDPGCERAATRADQQAVPGPPERTVCPSAPRPHPHRELYESASACVLSPRVEAGVQCVEHLGHLGFADDQRRAQANAVRRRVEDYAGSQRGLLHHSTDAIVLREGGSVRLIFHELQGAEQTNAASLADNRNTASAKLVQRLGS